jgi:hypothetical protein
MVGEYEGKRRRRRTRLRWEENITNILKKENGKTWTGFIWLRIGASGGLL